MIPTGRRRDGDMSTKISRKLGSCQRRKKGLTYKRKKKLEMPGIEPGAFHMQSERSTTELHPLRCQIASK
ncbi:unnamed protein product [Tenebrio molitor]|nr:unnamed protein product [Tenebrio molitor]